MRFLVDRCANRKFAEWLKSRRHDVLESRTLGADPGDRELLELAVQPETS
jgi:predicted nuclease of predicted toxin-antitoxin system